MSTAQSSNGSDRSAMTRHPSPGRGRVADSDHADRNCHPLARGNCGHQFDDVGNLFCYPENTVAFVGVVSLSVDGPSHDLFPGSGLHELLPAHHYTDPIDFVVILRETGKFSLESLFEGQCRQENSVHSPVVVEYRFLHLKLTSLRLRLIS